MSIYVANESSFTVDDGEVIGLARHVLDAMGVDPLAELSVLYVDTEAMSAYHEQYTGEPGPTDVLAFPQDEVLTTGVPDDDEEEPEALLGDVLICPDYAAESAKKQGHPTEEELRVLLVHGILHLLGFDHMEPDEEAEMFGKQRELLTSWRAVRAS